MNTPRDEVPRISSISCQVFDGIEMERLSTVGPLPLPRGRPAPGLAPSCMASKLTFADVPFASRLQLAREMAQMGTVVSNSGRALKPSPSRSSTVYTGIGPSIASQIAPYSAWNRCQWSSRDDRRVTLRSKFCAEVAFDLRATDKKFSRRFEISREIEANRPKDQFGPLARIAPHRF